MFNTKEVVDLMFSDKSNDRLMAEYWFCKEKYRNLLAYVAKHGVDFNSRANLEHLALRLNDIRILAAIHNIKLGSVAEVQKRLDKKKKREEKVKAPNVGVFVDLNKICGDFFDNAVIRKAELGNERQEYQSH